MFFFPLRSVKVDRLAIKLCEGKIDLNVVHILKQPAGGDCGCIEVSASLVNCFLMSLGAQVFRYSGQTE